MKNRTWTRATITIIGALTIGIAHAGPAGKKTEVISLMPAFFEAYAQSDAGERLKAFRNNVLSPAPDLYGPVIPVPDDARLSSYLDNLKPFETDMQTLSGQIEQQIPLTLTLLKSDLGSLRPAKIYNAPSLFTSNGQVRMSDKGPIVAFGPDVQAYAVQKLLDETPPYDVRALVAHELFHAQHYATNAEMGRMANRLFSQDDRPPLMYNLWIEGLATCEGLRLDGDGTVLDGLMSKELAAMTTKDARLLADELGGKLDSNALEDYRDYFWLSGKRTDIPKRAGYGFGVLIADQVVRKMGIRKATALKGEAVKSAMTEAMKHIRSDAYTLDWSQVCTLPPARRG